MVKISGFDIYGQRVSAGGARSGGDFGISGPAGISDEHVPAAAANQTPNEYLVVWEDGRNTVSRGRDIYGRRVAG